jgi:imidazolonepropionase-like amidohydrolase
MTTRHLIRSSVGISLIVILAAACEPGAGTTAYVGAEVFDGTGAPLLMDAVILVKDGRIEAVGPPTAVAVPKGAVEVRIDGKWVIPGLIDGHTHVERWTLGRFLGYGVTTVRDMGGTLDSVIALREAVSLGSTLGPRMFIAGAMIDAAPATWPSAIQVGTTTEGRAAIDRLVLLDVDQAKVYTKVDRPLLEAITDEANVLNLPLAAHLGRVDALTAARLGIRFLEHMSGVVEATAADRGRYIAAHNDFFSGWNLQERTWSSLDSAALDRTARELTQLGVSIVPTLTLHEAWANLTNPRFIERLDLSAVPETVRRDWDIPDLIWRADLDEEQFQAFRRARPYQDRFVRMFHRLGGSVIAGSDAPNQLLAPGASLHDEMALLVRAGLLPRDALLAATGTTARLLGADSIGVLRAGALADFVILNANPLEDIRNSRTIDRVVYRGVAYTPAELKERP